MGILLLEHDHKMVAILKLERGKNLVPIHTLRSEAYTIANLLFEVFFDRFN